MHSLAAPAPEEPGSGPGPGRGSALLGQAIGALARHRTIDAKIRHQVDLMGQQLFGSGRYSQQGTGVDALLRLQLQIQAVPQPSTLTQVCDGEYLWVHKQAGDDVALQRVSIDRVRKALGARRAPTGQPPIAGLSLGGLPRLLESLDEHFAFDSVQADRIDSTPVLLLAAGWRPKRLAEILPEEKDAILAGGEVDTSQLPPHLPLTVVVMLGRDDLFPYRIEFRRPRNKNEPDDAGGSDKPIVTMQFYEVRFGAPLDAQAFAYRPGTQRPTDATDAFLKKLGIQNAKQ